ncbi:MAG: type III glutamate--ammonia ligase [Thermoleophilia bacterium]|nr:type III glutamate--ammonia ligase [Thermoleophilia bacterium]
MSTTHPDTAGVAAELEARGVRHALASFVDVHGISKGKVVPIAHVPHFFDGSELYTGAALDAVPQKVNDEEVAAHPDPASATVLPWNPEIAWFASDLHLAGEPFPACSRGILKRALARAADMGYTFNLGVETEFYVLRDDGHGGVAPASDRDTLDKPCYDIRGMLDNYPWVSRIVDAMNELGWDVYSWDHEDGNGQFETDFAYADALTMADRVVFFRLMANEIVRPYGLFATFMPKPFGNRTGSGAHFNMSLADIDTGDNLFACDDDPRGCGLSELGYAFIAGILRHAPAVCAAIAPTVNSYKRLVARGNMSGLTWAPIQVSYGNNNRTNMLRIPLAGGRVECRAADISTNPYLGAAMILAAGLEGVREGLEPGEPFHEDMYAHTPAELDAMGIRFLPRTLGEAVEGFAADPLAREAFGPLMHDAFTEFKRAEWTEYHNHVSDWERDRYLRMF